MLIGDAGGDDAEVAIAHFNPVKRGRFGKFLEFEETSFHFQMFDLAEVWQHDVFGYVFDPFTHDRFDFFFLLHAPLGMGDTGGGPEHERSIELLGNFKAGPDKVVGLLGIGRIKHRNFGKPGIVAARSGRNAYQGHRPP